MTNADNIQKVFEQLNAKSSPALRRRILADAAQAMEQTIRVPARKPDAWRLIMKAKTTKFAAAATIVIAAVTVMNALTATPAWAIEQTIEALRDISGIYFEGIANYPGRSTEHVQIWTRPHSRNASVSGDFRLHEGDDHVSVASEAQNMTWVYTTRPGGGVVYVTEGINRHCQPFPTADLFSLLQEHAVDWQEQYRRDPVTGRDCVFVTCKGFPVNTAPYWKLQFDLETKFPVRAGVWFTSDYSGEPHFDFTTIVYNPRMPDDLFEFTVPQDAQVIDCDDIRRQVYGIADSGINVGTLNTEDACKKVAQKYWQAVFDQDAPALRQIRPLASDADWQQIFAVYAKNKPVTFPQMTMNHLNDPGTFVEVACTLALEDGQTAVSVLLIDIRPAADGKCGVVTGVLGPELDIQN